MIHEDDACMCKRCGCNDAPTQVSQDVPSLERTVEGSSGGSPTGTPGRDMIAASLTSGDSDNLDASPSGVVAEGEDRSYAGLVSSVPPQSPGVSECAHCGRPVDEMPGCISNDSLTPAEVGKDSCPNTGCLTGARDPVEASADVSDDSPTPGDHGGRRQTTSPRPDSGTETEGSSLPPGVSENPCKELPEAQLSPLRDPNADLIGYVFKVDGGTGTVLGSAHWDPAYVKIWVIKRNIDYYCHDCDLYADETIAKDSCFRCGMPLEAIEADPDERMLGWETVRSAGLVRRAKELRA